MKRLKPGKVVQAFQALGGRTFCSQPCRTRLGQYDASLFTASKDAKPQIWSGYLTKHSPARQVRFVNYEKQASELNQKGINDQLSEYDESIMEEQEKQRQAPWHREGAEEPPVKRQRSAGAMTKGKLLTTPSRLLKLVIPLTTVDINTDRKDVAPLALLVHPHQPLSYLERLIQSELPTITTKKGEKRVPSVSFRAVESSDDQIKPNKSTSQEKKGPTDSADASIGEGGVQAYSGAGREGEAADEEDFIRWNASTEIGDFIRDAARAKEFQVEIEGNPRIIPVAVPSFNDRTFYLRQKLRRTSEKIADMAKLKKECDAAAHRAGQRLAMAGCGGLVVYWYVVYRITFETDLGWDVMEPVTYLVGLSTLICGYLWFLFHNREVSYRSALNLTISRRQSKLYEQRGFDLHRWEALVEEGNALRKEIKAVASEYDVEWDEREDEKHPSVTKALRDDRKDSKSNKKKKNEDEDDEEDEDNDENR